MTITWLDATLVLMVAAFVAVGAHKKLIGLVVGVGAVLLLRPLLGLSANNLALAAAVGLLLGVVLGLVGRRLSFDRHQSHWAYQVLGGFGGLLLGLGLLFALVTSLPIQRNPANAQEIFYPPRNAPTALASTFQRSLLVAEGRSILLYPLLQNEELGATQRRVYAGLHDWLVVGEPWLEAVE